MMTSRSVLYMADAQPSHILPPGRFALCYSAHIRYKPAGFCIVHNNKGFTGVK